MAAQRIDSILALLGQPPGVIQDNGARGDTARVRDLVDTDDLRVLDILLSPSAVVARGLLVAIVSEAVPLGAALSVDVQMVVVNGSLGAVWVRAVFYAPAEGGTAERWVGGEIQEPVQRYAVACLYFLGCSFDGCGRYHVESA